MPSKLLMSISNPVKLTAWFSGMAIAIGLAWSFEGLHRWLHLAGVWMGALLWLPALFWLNTRISGQPVDSKRGRVAIVILAVLAVFAILAGLILQWIVPST